MFSLFFLIFCIRTLNVGAQSFYNSFTPYLKAGSYTKSPGLFASFANTATLAGSTSFSAGAYGEKKFLLQELASFSGACIVPAQSGVFGIQLHNFGNGSYNEFRGGISYARSLNEKLDVGVGFNYNFLSLQGYGSSSVVSADVGIIFHFTEQLHGGIQLSNLTRSFINKSKEDRLFSLYSFGVGYDVSDKLFITTEVEKYSNLPASLNASLQYTFVNTLFAKGGIATSNSTVFFGTGILIDNFFKIELVASLHPQLGLTPGLMLVYKKEKE